MTHKDDKLKSLLILIIIRWKHLLHVCVSRELLKAMDVSMEIYNQLNNDRWERFTRIQLCLFFRKLLLDCYYFVQGMKAYVFTVFH